MDYLARLIRRAYTARSLRKQLMSSGLKAPKKLGWMLASEPEAYIAAAIVAVNQVGE